MHRNELAFHPFVDGKSKTVASNGLVNCGTNTSQMKTQDICQEGDAGEG